MIKSNNNSSFFKLILVSLIVFLSITTSAQTPPVIYVSKDGTGDYNCNPDVSITNNQIEINQALDFVAANADYTTVYLKGSVTYIIDEPVLISNNTILTGDETASIELKKNVGWATYDKPMLTQKGRLGWHSSGIIGESILNIEIFGFSIDGGSVQIEPSGDRYNTLLHFTYPTNAKIHDMHFRNGQWDAVRLSSTIFLDVDDCEVYNNDIFNCGHDGVSFVGLVNCHAHHNTVIKTRTNSGLRATHCDSIYFHHNLIGNSISLPPSGYAGIQIQNTEIDYPCTYAEIYENMIYGKNEGIHLGEETNLVDYPTGTMKNVHIHHNKIYKTNVMNIGGGITLTGGIVVMGYQDTLIEHNIVDGSATDGISFRGNTGSHPGYQTIVRNNIIINSTDYGINDEEPANNTFIANNNLVYNNELGNYNNTSSTDDIYTPPLFGKSHSTLNQWNHIVASYNNDSETMKIFINGVEKSSASYPGLFGAIGSNSYNLLLGAIYNGNLWYEGRQDDFALWNRALSATEITDLYNEGTPIAITGSLAVGMQAYFKMENNWDDSSGNAFNAEDYTAGFTTEAISGDYAGLFDGVDDGVQYPTSISTADGLTISVWTYRTSLDAEIQTIVNKGRMDDFDHIWLYFRGESVLFEIGNGNGQREDIEAYIINPENMDYHIKSTSGRWDGTAWVNDTETSPCLDAGDLTSDFSNEPELNGGRVNVGVYGNTSEASKSSTADMTDYLEISNFIYPNPTTARLFISKEYVNDFYKIYTLTGKVILNGIFSTNFIDLSQLKSGIYLIKVLNKNKECVYLSKLIKI
jgi:hypothetical protein